MRCDFLLTAALSILILDCGNNAARERRATPATSPDAMVQTANATPASPQMSDTNQNRTMNDSQTSAAALDFNAQLRIVPNEKIVISYQVKNTSGRDYLLFNRGDDDGGLSEDRVYIEPQPDGMIELSQRAFLEPKDRACRDREAPLQFGVTVLRAGESLAREVSVPLPLTYQTPYDDCSPPPAMPAKIVRIKFCLGAIAADASRTKTGERQVRIVGDRQLLSQQQLLCSDEISLP